MIIKALTAENFRLLVSSSIEFEPGLNIIAGPNASGKTSVLEAIGYCLRGRSILGAEDEEVPTFGTASFYAKVNATNSKRNLIEANFDGKKTIKADGKSIRSFKELLDLFKLVVITPSSTATALGAPSLRRDFIDETASQISPLWANIINEYRSIVKDRNAMLKKDFSKNLLDVLNAQLAQTGKALRNIRREVIGNLNLITIEKGIKIELTEHDQLADADFVKYKDAEKARGLTLIGPHRDDCAFILDDKRVEKFASTGEARTVILMLKAAQADLIHKISAIEPLILADDLFAELDKSRTEEVLVSMGKYSQVIVTCACEIPKVDCKIIQAGSWKK